MTDTTDTVTLRVEIAELRLEIAKGYDRFIPETKIHIKLLERILDQIEAERQRAAGSEEELHKALHREKAAERKLLAAQEEIAAMKAQLVNPVVLPAGYSTRNGHPFNEGERNVMIPNKHGDWLSRFDVEHAIHVAGFTVKGE